MPVIGFVLVFLGQSILMSKEMFHLSPSQLYCITKQLQLPHPSGSKHHILCENVEIQYIDE